MRREISRGASRLSQKTGARPISGLTGRRDFRPLTLGRLLLDRRRRRRRLLRSGGRALGPGRPLLPYSRADDRGELQRSSSPGEQVSPSDAPVADQHRGAAHQQAQSDQEEPPGDQRERGGEKLGHAERHDSYPDHGDRVADRVGLAFGRRGFGLARLLVTLLLTPLAQLIRAHEVASGAVAELLGLRRAILLHQLDFAFSRISFDRVSHDLSIVVVEVTELGHSPDPNILLREAACDVCVGVQGLHPLGLRYLGLQPGLSFPVPIGERQPTSFDLIKDVPEIPGVGFDIRQQSANPLFRLLEREWVIGIDTLLRQRDSGYLFHCRTSIEWPVHSGIANATSRGTSPVERPHFAAAWTARNAKLFNCDSVATESLDSTTVSDAGNQRGLAAYAEACPQRRNISWRNELSGQNPPGAELRHRNAEAIGRFISDKNLSYQNFPAARILVTATPHDRHFLATRICAVNAALVRWAQSNPASRSSAPGNARASAQ